MALFRLEPGRRSLSDQYQGIGRNITLNNPIKYRAIDVSHHGLGCVIEGVIGTGNLITLQLGQSKVAFEVMWVESHLGIENHFRVGLLSSDHSLDIDRFFY